MRRTARASPEAAPAPPGGGGSARAGVEITFPSSSEYLALLRCAARWFARRCGFADRDCGRIVLAAVEATTNIIRHAYGMDAAKRITLRMREVEGGLELEFLDEGKAVPPEVFEQARREVLKPGGLGVRMMKRCMDGFSYEPRPEGGARLILRKLRGAGCGEDAP
ncbi:MAG: ATP-binding protein [Planctomycetes bacterium]|nr:ATP-binding protein [Planctomycetota bacterium]